jgi:hypothetical protein
LNDGLPVKKVLHLHDTTGKKLMVVTLMVWVLLPGHAMGAQRLVHVWAVEFQVMVEPTGVLMKRSLTHTHVLPTRTEYCGHSTRVHVLVYDWVAAFHVTLPAKVALQAHAGTPLTRVAVELAGHGATTQVLSKAWAVAFQVGFLA